MKAAVKDEDGIPLRHGDYITFSFGIPPISVLARLTEADGKWMIECIDPPEVKPRRSSLADLRRSYPIWKASQHRVARANRNFEAGGGQ